MHKAVLIVIMQLLAAGLTQPSGILQPLNMREKYAHCSIEDHDITPLDFVFEHLLNLEILVNLIEGEHEYKGQDYPHEPFQVIKTGFEITAAMPHYILYEANRQTFTEEPLKHDNGYTSFYTTGFSSNLFRPPIQKV